MTQTARTINPSRLELARRRRGLSKTKLAALVNLEPRTIAAYEKGEFAPSRKHLSN